MTASGKVGVAMEVAGQDLQPGKGTNQKITIKEEIPPEMRVGKGLDVHRFGDVPDVESGNPCKVRLGGVDIPSPRPLLAYSDGDVLVHAIMDALLGAAGLGDIGKLFPDTDPVYKGADSIGLLGRVSRLLAEEGWRVGNVDSTVICQRPKIAEHTDSMKEIMARALGVSPGQINVKGTTTEELGFTGRGEGIAAEAICLLLR